MKCRNKKIFWTQKQDILICNLVKRLGTKNWAKMAQQVNQSNLLKDKSGKQCRERWYNHLNPNISKKQWTLTQEDQLFQLHRKFGNKWTCIAEKLKGRSDNSIKNHFYSVIRKSLRRINKFLGQKNSTIKVQKIKSFLLTRIFSMVLQQTKNNKLTEEQVNCKQFAYHLIKFSRSKLADQKEKISKEDVQKIQKLINEISKISDKCQKQLNLTPIQLIDGVDRDGYLQSQCLKQKMQPKNMKDQSQSVQIHAKFLNIQKQQTQLMNQDNKDDSECQLQCQIQQIQKDGQYQQRQFKQQQNKKDQDMISPDEVKEQQNFQFCINFDQIQISDLNLRDQFPLTPNLITPSGNKAKFGYEMAIPGDQWQRTGNDTNEIQNQDNQ